MVSRDNLVPTLTVDKNGRTTTVHKRRVTGEGAKSIPSAENTGTVVRRKELIHGLATEMQSTWAGGNADAFTRKLKKYPDDLLTRLAQVQMENRVGFMQVVRIAITKGDGVKRISEYACFLSDLNPSSYYDANDYYAARDHISSLHQYTHLPESEDFSNESDELKSQCRALLTVQRECQQLDELEVFRLESGAFVIDDDDLVELILENPDKAKHIADFIRERKSIDVALIAEVIASDASALGTGTL